MANEGDTTRSVGDRPTGSYVTPASPSRVASGTLIGGRYRIVEHLEDGGFGSVYVAEQTDPIRRLVALKVIRLGLDTPQVLARFDAERQAMGMMNHPHIAKIYDGGVTSDDLGGTPFFVMELVDGVPIDRFCDSRRMSLVDRVRLMQMVCGALYHANSRGIVHRDLKPSNILVSMEADRPHVKLIDFGVAKALTTPLSKDAVYTRDGQVVGTPGYMSPEQALGRARDIDQRSDVYGVGAVLHRLLVDKLAIDPADFTDLEAWKHHLMESEILRPSDTFLSLDRASRERVADLRGLTATTLVASMREELDLIVMQTMRVMSSDRYANARDLEQDLERFLVGEPVEAHPPSVTYFVKRWVSRGGRAQQAGMIVFLFALFGVLLNGGTAVLGAVDYLLGTAILRDYGVGEPMDWLGFFVFMLGFAVCEAGMCVAGLRFHLGKKRYPVIVMITALVHAVWLLVVILGVIEFDVFGLHPEQRSLAMIYLFFLMMVMVIFLAAAVGLMHSGKHSVSGGTVMGRGTSLGSGL
ncbi:serine/threonine-protein kinase [Mucisphaera sp.]|uniref:serine/threonine-protein kinase n=1 Tax=Mucisphaera sp. TaxID=2913024 RepID=UPI003D0BB9B3